jgi:hypothetical protein
LTSSDSSTLNAPRHKKDGASTVFITTDCSPNLIDTFYVVDYVYSFLHNSEARFITSTEGEGSSMPHHPTLTSVIVKDEAGSTHPLGVGMKTESFANVSAYQ